MLTDLFSLLSMYNCPATNIRVAKTITKTALASCETSFILLHPNIADARGHSPRRTPDLGVEFQGFAGL
jgi:hypothetical protein